MSICKNIKLASSAIATLPVLFMSPSSMADVSLEEIVVTAEKREQNLQQVPVAVSAFSADFIEKSRIEGFDDIASRVPGFSFSSFSKVRTFPAIRGASSSVDAPGGDQAVAIFIDDVFHGAIGDFDPFLFDLERIEVLRGPQGTLFGRNVVGGAISIVTRKPSEEAYAKVEAGVSNFNGTSVTGAFGGALGDNVFGQVSFSSKSRSGSSYNRTTGQSVDSIEKDMVRGRIRFVPSDNLEIMIAGDYFRDSSSGEARDFLGPAPTIPELAGFEPDSDPWVVDQYANGEIDRETYGVSAVVNWALEGGTVSSISAYRKNNSILYDADALGTPVPTWGGDFHNDLSQFSQEFRYVSENEGPFNWVGGLYYLHIANSRLEDLTLNFYDGTSFGAEQLATFGTLGAHKSQFYQDVTTNSYAGYVQGTYDLTDALTLTAGARYTHDKKSGTGWVDVDPNLFYGDTDFAIAFSESWNAFTPKVSLSYDLTDDAMLYGTVSKGFKSGGFVILDTAAGSEVPYGQEVAWNYEAGLKSQWLDDRLRVNLTGFHVEYTDLQVDTTLPNGLTIVTNAGKATVTGVEVEVQAAPVEGLQIWGTYSYQDSEYKDFGDFTGARLALSPPHTVSLGGSYTAEIGEGSYLSFQTDFQHKSKHDLEPRPVGAGEEAFRTGVSSLVNGSITWGFGDGRWEVILWGKNLTDEDFVVYGQDLRGFVYSDAEIENTGAGVANFPRYNTPRTYGLSVRWAL